MDEIYVTIIYYCHCSAVIESSFCTRKVRGLSQIPCKLSFLPFLGCSKGLEVRILSKNSIFPAVISGYETSIFLFDLSSYVCPKKLEWRTVAQQG